MDAQFALYQRTPPASVAPSGSYIDKLEVATPSMNKNNDGSISYRHRKLITEPYTSRMANLSSDSLDELGMPVRRYTPLPDIPRSDDVYFRTESRLLKEPHENISNVSSSNQVFFDT